MNVKKKGNVGVVNYRGVTFTNEDVVDVSPEWFAAVKSPTIIEVKTPARKTLTVKAENVTD